MLRQRTAMHDALLEALAVLRALMQGEAGMRAVLAVGASEDSSCGEQEEEDAVVTIALCLDGFRQRDVSVAVLELLSVISWFDESAPGSHGRVLRAMDA